MDAMEIKKYIYDKDLIAEVVEKIGCHNLHNYDKEIRCALPGGDDSSKVSVFRNENLGIRIFNKGETINGSIYDLIMFIDNCDFPTALYKCAGFIGENVSYKTRKDNYLNVFNRIKRNKQHKVSQLKTYDLSILNKYSNIPHIDLIRKDGLFQNVIDKYQIKFDFESNRIVFPHFLYNDKSKVVGLVGRTVDPAYEELNIPKYFPVDGIKYEKSKNLYGLSHNIDEIKRLGFVLVYEAEKSVLKSDMMGFPNSVSVGCHDISDFQRKLLIKLNVEIVIAFDNDVENNYIKELCNKLNIYRKTTYIKDKWNLLDEKDSPVDCGRKKFLYLLKHRGRS